jgi:hypothetical protein
MRRLAQRRWNPGKGFIKVTEWGDSAVWCKPLADGCLVAIYMPDWWDNLDSESMPTLWYHVIISVPRGSWLPDNIIDKMWRWRWADRHQDPTEPSWTAWGAVFLLRELRPPSHKIYHRKIKPFKGSTRKSWERGHKILFFDRERRYAHRARGGKPFGLPQSVRRALAPKRKEIKELIAYQQQEWDKWEEGSKDVAAISGDSAVSLVR